MTKPLLVTMGDPAGIGGEILLKAVLDPQLNTAGQPLIAVDDPARLQQLADELAIPVAVIALEPGDDVPSIPAAGSGDEAQDKPVLYVWPLPMPVAAKLGEPSVNHAPAITASIDRATAAVLTGAAAALVTNPIAKDVLLQAGFRYPGHTEYLGHLAQTAGHDAGGTLFTHRAGDRAHTHRQCAPDLTPRFNY